MTRHLTVCSFLMILSTLTILQRVECLECYRCMYLHGITIDDLGYSKDDPYLKLDDSCEYAPKSEYLHQCADDKICHSNIVEEYLQSDNDEEIPIKIVDRGCVEVKKLERVEFGCESFDSFERFRLTLEGSQEPFPFEKHLSPTSTTNFTRCHCNEDECNGSSRSSFGPNLYFWFIFMAVGLLTCLTN